MCLSVFVVIRLRSNLHLSKCVLHDAQKTFLATLKLETVFSVVKYKRFLSKCFEIKKLHDSGNRCRFICDQSYLSLSLSSIPHMLFLAKVTSNVHLNGVIKIKNK